MSENANDAREINLGKDFGSVRVKANGAEVSIDADGSVCVISSSKRDSGTKPRTEPYFDYHAGA